MWFWLYILYKFLRKNSFVSEKITQTFEIPKFWTLFLLRPGSIKPSPPNQLVHVSIKPVDFDFDWREYTLVVLETDVFHIKKIYLVTFVWHLKTPAIQCKTTNCNKFSINWLLQVEERTLITHFWRCSLCNQIS